MEIIEILRTAHEHDASDIHLITGHPPMMRVNTVMTPLDHPVLTPESVEEQLRSMITETQMRRFKEIADLQECHIKIFNSVD